MSAGSAATLGLNHEIDSSDSKFNTHVSALFAQNHRLREQYEVFRIIHRKDHC